MNESSEIELKRDCDAVQIPVGAEVKLPAGTRVFITQSLGGGHTVQAPGGLFRIAAKDADALGVSVAPSGITAEKSPDDAAPVSEEAVWQTLKNCYDPEIPVNIVDLGLVYDLQIKPLPGGGAVVSVKMTLTAPGCGMGTFIAADARQQILALPGVTDASVEVVWDPPWHQSMISAEGRRILGLE